MRDRTALNSPRLFPAVSDHVGVAVFDARLHDHGQGSIERLLRARGSERGPMNLDRMQSGLRARHVDPLDGFERAARHGNFGADDVRQLEAIRRGFGREREPRGAAGSDVVRQGCAFAGAAHAGVEMQLREASLRVGRDHRLRATHRLFRWQMLPRIGAEMVATQESGVRARSRSCRRSSRQSGESRPASSRCSRPPG